MTKLGFVAYQGPSLHPDGDGGDIVAIVTTGRSRNVKTGNMAQLWILRADKSPVEAVKDGSDDAICGECPHRHHEGGACYVVVGNAPQSVWRAWKRGRYSEGVDEDALAGRVLRLGAYGDPAAVPTKVLNRMTKAASSWTGYTHAWRSLSRTRRRSLRGLMMASVDSATQHKKAKRGGWRTFRVALSAAADRVKKEIVCPSESHAVQCIDCTLCQGTTKAKAADIRITVHGSRAGAFQV